MRYAIAVVMGAGMVLSATRPAAAQAYGPPDRGQPGDAMIQAWLAGEADKLHDGFMEGVTSADDWRERRPEYKRQYMHMLGLWPLPERTDLHATVTGRLEGDGYVVEMLHYQSRPHLYVTANLYRPARIEPGQRLPAVFYVCGHSPRGRNGNKTAYQSHGIWFARHGYVCLVVDSLQLGEIAAIHHGTYREKRWWWHSRGYTSAGVEAWNGIRGIDYLISRDDVDADRIAVTGISGGGAATFWIAAADERVKVAVPVSGMADLPSYISNRVINGHCDCMFLYNTYRWPWARIAALIAPRPMLFVNSDQDRIFPMDANERIINQLERLYSLYGAGDHVDSLVSMGGHAYRKDIRQAAFRFINMHLKNDPRIVEDSEIDLVTGPRNERQHPIAPERLTVFPSGADIPTDELNTTIDQHFVPIARVAPPMAGQFTPWKQSLLDALRTVTFRDFPERIPAARNLWAEPNGPRRVRSEGPIEFTLRPILPRPSDDPERIVLLVVMPGQDDAELPDWFAPLRGQRDRVVACAPRGVDPMRWTQRDPPNYVARSHALLGRTVDAGRIWDIAAAARLLHEEARGRFPVHIAGRGSAGVLAAYAALLEPSIAAVTIADPPATHMDADAPALLNVLRVCDIPDVLGMLAPRPLTLIGTDDNAFRRTAQAYEAAGAAAHLARRPG